MTSRNRRTLIRRSMVTPCHTMLLPSLHFAGVNIININFKQSAIHQSNPNQGNLNSTRWTHRWTRRRSTQMNTQKIHTDEHAENAIIISYHACYMEHKGVLRLLSRQNHLILYNLALIPFCNTPQGGIQGCHGKLSMTWKLNRASIWNSTQGVQTQV